MTYADSIRYCPRCQKQTATVVDNYADSRVVRCVVCGSIIEAKVGEKRDSD